VKAVHDRHFANPPADWAEYRWRLQLLAEESIGSSLRRHARAEDAAFTAAADVL